MATMLYFADLPDGQVLQFDRIHNRNQSLRHTDSWGWTGSDWVKVTRVVERKSNPSRHACDAGCLHATGRTMRCECACGGKNHGRGRFSCDPD